VKLITAGKLAVGVTGTAGAGSMGALVEVLVHIATLHAVSTATWVMVAILAAMPVLVACLGLVVGYRLRRLEVESAADLEKARQEMYRALLEESAATAISSADHRELIDADTMHLLAERSDIQPNGRSYRRIRRPNFQG
jgi:putative protein kinase ArgK-like GTPase of G3E family